MSVAEVLSSAGGAAFSGFVKSVKSVVYFPVMIAGKVVMYPYDVFEKSSLYKKVDKLFKSENPVHHLKLQSLKLLEKHGDDIGKVDGYLIAGERLKAAEVLAPKKKYPHLYRNVPDDLKRSVIEDGRTCNGVAPAIALAGAALTENFVIGAWRDSTRAALRVTYLSLLLFAVASVFTYFSGSVASMMVKGDSASIAFQSLMTDVKPTNHSQAEQNDAMKASFIAQNYADVFDQATANSLFDDIGRSGQVAESAKASQATASSYVRAILFFALFMLGATVASAGIGRMFWIARFRGLVREAVNTSVGPFRFHMREALQRWRWRIPEREMLLSAYDDQLKFATEIDRSPLVEIGVSTGLLEHRGHLLAPLHNSTVKMSIVDLMQHVEVLGGSGEGKSRNVYLPLVRQLIHYRKQGYPISIYATDDKGSIGLDIVEACRAADLPDSEVVCIGTGPKDYRIDLCDGLSPVEFADVVRSVSAQLGGSSKDDFWPEMASDLIAQVGILLQAFEQTAAGKAWMHSNDMRCYSILNLLRVASSDAVIADTITAVTDAIQSEYEVFDEDVLPQSLNAMQYLTDAYLPLVAATKDGIRANMRKALKSFAAQPAIAEGFASGMSQKLLPVSVLRDPRIKVINVSQIEFGSAGRIVSVMLKTLLFKQARLAELRDPAAAKARMKWWFNPDLSLPNLDQYAITVFLADEYQALVTASLGDGMSDATAWNVLRSAGIAGVLLSQSVSAFKMAVGAEATENMRKNWRTKIVLRTEDLDTIEEAKKLAGKTMRFYAMNNSLVESAAAAKREFEVCAEQIPEILWDESLSKIPVSFNMMNAASEFAFSGFNDPYKLDERFIKGRDSIMVNFLMGGPIGDKGTEQAAYWRQEDKISSALQHGIVEVEAVRDEDIMEMGRGRALVYAQRAGGTRVDIVKLND